MGLFSPKQKPHPGTPSDAVRGPGMVADLRGDYANVAPGTTYPVAPGVEPGPVGLPAGYMPGFYAESPQFYPGEAPATYPNWQHVRIPEEVTSGFDETGAIEFNLHYTARAQPDVGGALNYSYDNYGLPLNDVCGPWMVARHPTRPIGQGALAFFQEAPVTSIGGLIPGEFIHQPLLDPNAPGSGYDYG